ncbi:FKBP-type peptidyl-prolyl cis-trans isomerase [Pontixanthobacter aestiaquae]|uniref:Peptidyl-prolyl cis-trans isomerase n=1 Tax=Pontixanthobacter aestiaquae TaxID=1509367 RepID=A0A844Z3C1_9SPHN|nr:FKBP-type peptidyl-prolyl cis-trans isomerase [Pontixanthobacter aestiaquae]MDN3646790.1 FKBP-type peptidyl-prolyl cis-trans isomerase [Pontixanthobacter aestiaquae]MXO82228.1 FKBP-type peptidyl-prolyl cis-trans isomerase [Pontixanthobacter aestiaquae]
MHTIYAVALSAAILCAVPTQAQNTETEAEEIVDPERGAAWHNAQQAALAERTYKDGWRWVEGGLLWRNVKGNRTGARATVRDTVTLHYAGTFVDGTTFDSSYDRGQPATFPLRRLIKAWQLAVPQMTVGDTIEIAAPASIAYGARGGNGIPGGATLLFTIELLAIQ